LSIPPPWPASCLPTPLTTAPAPSPSGPTINNKPFVDFGLDGGGGAGGAVTVVGGAGYRSGWHEDQSLEPPLFRRRGLGAGGMGGGGGGGGPQGGDWEPRALGSALCPPAAGPQTPDSGLWSSDLVQSPLTPFHAFMHIDSGAL